jgi:hypothetical protein
MNERITAIMQKCFDISIDQRGREECTADYTNIQMFVQLIVQECLKDIETAAYHDSCEDWEYGYNSGLNKAKELIVIHFEVEE